MLKVENLKISFNFAEKISTPVRNVSFYVPQNGRIALVGESGCGKSLTALSLNSLVDRAKISGKITGSPKISYIFQNPMQSLNPVMRVGKQVAEALEKSCDKKTELKKLFLDTALPLEAVEKYPCELSGGQQQRVMIAMALAAKPDLLIADEPTTALDVTTQKEVLDLITRVADERKMAFLLITHNLGLVSKYAKYMYVMYAGEIVEEGDVSDVLKNPRHPYTRGLLDAVPSLRAPKNAPLKDIPGAVPPPNNWPNGCAFHPRCSFAKPECSAIEWKKCYLMQEGK